MLLCLSTNAVAVALLGRLLPFTLNHPDSTWPDGVVGTMHAAVMATHQTGGYTENQFLEKAAEGLAGVTEGDTKRRKQRGVVTQLFSASRCCPTVRDRRLVF